MKEIPSVLIRYSTWHSASRALSLSAVRRPVTLRSMLTFCTNHVCAVPDKSRIVSLKSMTADHTNYRCRFTLLFRFVSLGSLSVLDSPSGRARVGLHVRYQTRESLKVALVGGTVTRYISTSIPGLFRRGGNYGLRVCPPARSRVDNCFILAARSRKIRQG